MTRTSTRTGLRVGADRLDFPVFEKAQQHRLHAQAHFGDFIEEDGPAVRQLQFADLFPVGAGEAALCVTKELGFEKTLREAAQLSATNRWSARGDSA